MIYLASKSIRRQELLQQIGVHFELLHTDIDESRHTGEAPHHYVSRMANEKARAGRCTATRNWPVLAADTIVVLNNDCLGKPRNKAHAHEMLRNLSGHEHQVLTAITVESGGKEHSTVSATRVSFHELSDTTIERYWYSGEPQDKAGGYAIQGKAAVFVNDIQGSYSGVVGLPLFETSQLLNEVGIDCWQDVTRN